MRCASEKRLRCQLIPVGCQARSSFDFDPDEIIPGIPERPVRETVRAIERREPARTRDDTFFIHRQLCEVADQWSFIDVPGIGAVSRERLLIGEEEPAVRRRLGMPVRRLDMELLRPFFLFDEGRIHTDVYVHDNATTLVHRLTGLPPDDKPHAVVVEQLAAHV